ncbi:hypothetical protein BACSTE_03843 [Bacteroides stercoris ATCC 43183]|uniref:Uncharacterized protein n=1 Tax=Bacteroides stercoris ATCC 43183 TaxID=449673 RepID=B0NWF8_BACSE|nr:hypothetical protein BACSTE_03843 [Bacteroides stercoris ATCC 43183]
MPEIRCDTDMIRYKFRHSYGILIRYGKGKGNFKTCLKRYK